MNDLELVQTVSQSEKELEVLSRIASALEVIAFAIDSHYDHKPQQKKRETPFPWHEMSFRTQKYLQGYIGQQIKEGNALYQGMKWPLTCEDIAKLGRVELMNARNVGVISWLQIESKLKQMGM